MSAACKEHVDTKEGESNASPTAVHATPEMTKSTTKAKSDLFLQEPVSLLLQDLDIVTNMMTPDFMWHSYEYFPHAQHIARHRPQSSSLKPSKAAAIIPRDVVYATAGDKFKSRTPSMMRKEQTMMLVDPVMLRWSATPKSMRSTHAHHRSIVG